MAMQFPVSLSRDGLGGVSGNVATPYSQGGVPVTIYDAPPELASLPAEGTMLVRFCRDEASINTRGEEPRIRIELRITEILEVKAEAKAPDEETQEELIDKLFKEAKAEEAELPDEE